MENSTSTPYDDSVVVIHAEINQAWFDQPFMTFDDICKEYNGDVSKAIAFMNVYNCYLEDTIIQRFGKAEFEELKQRFFYYALNPRTPDPQ